MKNVFLCGVMILLAACMAVTQDYPKAEIGVGYSYLNENTHVWEAGGIRFARSLLGGLNGGDAAITFNLNSVLGLKADFAGYTQRGNFASSGKTFSYAFGPVIKKHSGVFNPFGELLVGGAHKTVSGFDLTAGQNSFTGIAGGGLDLKVSQHFSVRAAEVDYMWTAYHNVKPASFLVVTSRQNNFRYIGGVVFSF